MLEDLAREAGLDPGPAGEVDVPYATRDYSTLERALVAGAGLRSAVEHAGAEAVRRMIIDAAARFRQPEGFGIVQDLTAHA